MPPILMARVPISHQVIVQPANRHTRARCAGTQCRWSGSEVDDEAPLPPARLGYGYLQIPPVGRWIEIVDHKRARRHTQLADDLPVLAHRHQCASLGESPYHGRIAALRIGQHPFIGHHACADECNGRKQAAVGHPLTDQQPTIPTRNIPLQ